MKTYAYGLDVRLNGEFVAGTESWFSFGYLKTEESMVEKSLCSPHGPTFEIWSPFSRLYSSASKYENVSKFGV